MVMYKRWVQVKRKVILIVSEWLQFTENSIVIFIRVQMFESCLIFFCPDRQRRRQGLSWRTGAGHSGSWVRPWTSWWSDWTRQRKVTCQTALSLSFQIDNFVFSQRERKSFELHNLLFKWCINSSQIHDLPHLYITQTCRGFLTNIWSKGDRHYSLHVIISE